MLVLTGKHGRIVVSFKRMAKGRIKKKPAKKPTFNPKQPKGHPFLGILCALLGAFLLVSLLDFDPEQSSIVTTNAAEPEATQNLAGRYGAMVGFWTTYYLGLASYLLPLTFLWLGYMLFCKQSHKLNIAKYALIILALVAGSAFSTAIGNTFLSLQGLSDNTFPQGLGGLCGGILVDGFLASNLGLFGSIFIPFAILIFALWGLIHDNLVVGLRLRLKKRFVEWKEKRKIKAEERAKAAEAKKREAAHRKPVIEEPISTAKSSGVTGNEQAGTVTDPRGKSHKTAEAGKEPSGPLMEEPEPTFDEDGMLFEKFGDMSKSEAAAVQSAPEQAPSPTSQTPSTPGQGGLKIIAGEKTRKADKPLPEKKGDYTLPPLKLLIENNEEPDQSMEDHQATADLLVRILGEFGVKVTMGEVHTGPVITRYDIHPAPGVRVEKIVNLDKNIALGLKAMSVRILAPVPGKGCVGIEVPNRKPMAVGIREIIESDAWVDSKADIPIALGREVSGRPLIADLARMPHLLIAGATGSGKTVCINSIVSSLLYHFSPEDLRFVMIDPKIVEMQIYNSLPHMLIPVVTDPKKVPSALKHLINEMTNRYQIFAKFGVRNIAGFNAKQADKKASEASDSERDLEAELSPEERAAVSSIEVPRDEEIEIPEKLPYIVCIVDELADLMMVAPADVETCVARLAQLARATGIHLIIATQRPSVNVITGVIKANLPSRIAFKVASKVDSRTILDGNGADHLIGRGDMLFLPPGSHDFIRSQGSFVSDDEINGVVEFLKRNGPPEFDEHFQRSVDEGIDITSTGSSTEDLPDELIPDAVEVIRTSKRASTSMLQRRLKIGYNRAARIMEILEDRGIVGPDNGSQPREILKDLDNFSL